MKKSVWVALIVLIVGALALSACGGGGGNGEGAERQDPPAEYAGMTNPFEGDAEAVTAGQSLYATNCAGCHGDNGGGDGPAAASLDPKPANLANTVAQTDPQYSHWVISEGGAAAGISSSMPAFKGSLSDEDIWRIVTFMEESF